MYNVLQQCIVHVYNEFITCDVGCKYAGYILCNIIYFTDHMNCMVTRSSVGLCTLTDQCRLLLHENISPGYL